MKLIFDVDGTLYAYSDTHFEKRIITLIIDFFMETLHLSREDANALSEDYFMKYGLAATGLKRDHPNVDLHHFTRYIHNLDYSILKPEPRLTHLLQQLKDNGHELWIMTNADMPHARCVLEGLGVTNFFQNENGELRGFDCFLQWEHAEDQNKPMRGAYEALHRMMDPTISHSDVAMIDDAYANLEAPHRLGWKTVWISHGRTWPETAQFNPDVTIEKVHDIKNEMFSLVE